MSETIWKYEIKITDYQEILMPFGAKILCVQTQLCLQRQEAVPCLWAEVNPNNSPDKPTPIFIVGTGHPIPRAALNYIGTIQQYGGNLIWHIYSGEKS
jgi:hypothetical protein